MFPSTRTNVSAKPPPANSLDREIPHCGADPALLGAVENC